MRPAKRPWFASIWFPSLMLAIGVVMMGLAGSSMQSTTAGPDRLDFTAAEGQTAFPTSNVSPKPNVQVFRNGLLQRPGPAPFDYTQQYIQNGTRIRITFNSPVTGMPLIPSAGDYVTLFYWR